MAEEKKVTKVTKVTKVRNKKSSPNKDKWGTTGGALKPVDVKKIVWDKH